MPNQHEPLDLIWGAAAIGAFIGRTERQAWEALDKGDLPARKVNGRWCASRSRLAAFFAGEGDGSARAVTPARDDGWVSHKHAIAEGIAERAAQEEQKRSGKPVKRQLRGATVHKLLPRKGRVA